MVSGILFVLITAPLAGVCFILLMTLSQKSLEKDLIEIDRDYAQAIAREYKKLATKYYNAALNAEKKTKISSETSVSWRVVFGYSKTQALSKSDINLRYKKLAMIHHPDAGGSEYGMKLLNLAKEKADVEIK